MPRQVSELLDAYGETPLFSDPFGDASLKLVTAGKAVTIYSLGEDGDDDGGQPEGDDEGDLVLVLNE